MILTPKTKLDSLLKDYPFLLEFLAGWNPRFQKLRNPVLRKTVGKVASLDQAAGFGEVPVGRLLEAVAGEIRRVVGGDVRVETASGDSGPSPIEGREARKEVLKDIIRDLHAGGDPEALKKRFAGLVHDVSGSEIGAMEQELISEGLPEEEVRRLCDVHVRVFQEALDGHAVLRFVPGHPLHTLAAENRALEKLVAEMREILSRLRDEARAKDGPADLALLSDLLRSVGEVEKHYLKKENQLFPALEAHGVSGPSKVMWAIHDDIRAHLKDLRRAIDIGDRKLTADTGAWVLTEISDLITKEEKILFPMCLETLNEADWARVRKGEEEAGYAWITPGDDWRPAAAPAEREGERAAPSVVLETGSLTSEQVNWMMTRLPVDVSFVDANDTVIYYSATPDRIFPRTPGVIGRKVQNCHPPKSVDVVNRILEAFRAGRKDEAEFWIEAGGRFIHIRYFALRDGRGLYRGCLEVSQDVTAIRALRGQKRLLDWDPGPAD